MKLQNNFSSAGNHPSVYSPINSFLIPNFLNFQRSSFQEFLKNGLITEFQRYNPIKNSDKTIEIFFHANHYKLHQPKWTPKQAILKRKSYSCPLFMPIQLTNLKTEESSIQWLLVANLPLMTKHGHFILNGSPRVIMNQMVRSPGVYFKKTKNTSKREVYYADFIAQRGAWLRLEVDTKTGDIWAKLKKTPKIPVFIFLRSLGLSLPILNSFIDLIKLKYLLQLDEEGKNKTNLKLGPFSEDSVKTPQLKFLLEGLRDVLKQRLNKKKATAQKKIDKAKRKRIREYVKANRNKEREFVGHYKETSQKLEKYKQELKKDIQLRWEEMKLKEKKQSKDEEQHEGKMANLIATKKKKQEYKVALNKARRALNREKKEIVETEKELGRTQKALNKVGKDWLKKGVRALLKTEMRDQITSEKIENKFEKFKQGLVKRQGQFTNFKDFVSVTNASTTSDLSNEKINVSFLPKKKERDFLYMDQGKSLSDLSDKLFPFLPEKTEIEEGFIENPIAKAQKFLFRRFLNSRTYDFSPLGRLRINKKLGISIPLQTTTLTAQDVIFACLFLMDLIQGERTSDDIDDLKNRKIKPSGDLVQTQLAIGLSALEKKIQEKFQDKFQEPETKPFSFADLVHIASRPINQSFREFFGTSPLSQLMDETNPLAELTHKRRLSSLGPGGIERETAGMSIRGIHPTHYGRICPIETPEGQNAGLVNSITTYAQFNKKGFLETPFYKAYKGFILKNLDPFLLSSDQENLSVLAPGDIPFSKFHFVPKNIELPARYFKEFKRVSRNTIDFISLSPIQMISVATSLIPFLEHDDGNRALMGSNMQRQAISTLRLSKPIVGTGLESRVISDVGHNLQAKKSGFISYVDGKQIHIYSKNEEAQLPLRGGPLFLPSPLAGLLPTLKGVAAIAAYPKGKSKGKGEKKGEKQKLQEKRLKKNFFENFKPKTLLKTSTPSRDTKKDESCFLYNRSANNLTLSKYDLDSYFRSNQDTYTVHRPLVKEGQWVEKGDSLADGSSSKQGELSLGQNLLVGYTPWEGYNFEDAVLISERVVFDDVYTSLHIERYEVEVRDTSYGLEQITNQIPTTFSELDYLDDNGIAKIGTWVKENDILVGKIAPLDEKNQSPYRNLLYDIIGKERPKTRDTSLRVPKGVSGRVIHIEILETVDKNQAYPLSSNSSQKNLFPSKSEGKSKKKKVHLFNSSTTKTPDLSRTLAFATAPVFSKNFFNKSLQPTSTIVLKTISPGILRNLENKEILRFAAHKKRKTKSFSLAFSKVTSKKISKLSPKVDFVTLLGDLLRKRLVTSPTYPSFALAFPLFPLGERQGQGRKARAKAKSKGKGEKQGQGRKVGKVSSQKTSSFVAPVALLQEQAKDKKKSFPSFLSPVKVHIYVAEKRKLQLGDKIAGRHGNKGIVSNILPRQDMPYLPDGTPLDIVLNPLGVPSRMNVGQIFECLLGLAGYYLKQNYKIRPFDEVYGSEASRSLVYSKLYEARCRTGQSWLFNPNFPGKMRLFDGRTGECFQQPITVGVAYILKLVHLVDHKIHARSTGPYSLVTQQPLRGRSKQGGQRVGEMEVWALEGFGAAYILQEILTVKSDDLEGRDQILRCILQNEPIKSGIPESFKVLIRELQSLCLDIVVFKASRRGPTRLNIEKFPEN